MIFSLTSLNVYLEIPTKNILLVGTKCDLRDEETSQGGVTEKLWHRGYRSIDEEMERKSFVSKEEAEEFSKANVSVKDL